uniref:Uncharacterized protein n=1 Tax=Globisporangium ultimum (strain ATCC 200006 / CBS 805.95 / DAOM BR144) TaxID=431595 RepID=K3W4Y4_GLOUD
MRLWTHAPAAAAASPTAGAGAAASAAAAVSDQFKTFVELKIQELTSARRELAAAVEEAKKMRATASAPALPTTSSRCRSLSSTWETTDSDDVGDEEDDVEEYDEDADDLETQQREDAARRKLFLNVDYDDDMEHEESKDEFHDLAHGKDVASLARAGSTNALPILRRLAGASSSSSSDEDVTTATYPSALPAVRVSGRRRSNSRNSRSRRRRTRSESAASGVSNGQHNNHSSNSQIQASHTPRERRLRIISPIGSKIFFSGWVRGQPADVLWEVFDKSVQCVRIDVCNVGWNVPTTIAQNEVNDGHYQWRKVVWGLPIKDGYYVNIYDATGPLEPGETGPLLATSERFAVIG